MVDMADEVERVWDNERRRRDCPNGILMAESRATDAERFATLKCDRDHLTMWPATLKPFPKSCPWIGGTQMCHGRMHDTGGRFVRAEDHAAALEAAAALRQSVDGPSEEPAHVHRIRTLVEWASTPPENPNHLTVGQIGDAQDILRANYRNFFKLVFDHFDAALRQPREGAESEGEK